LYQKNWYYFQKFIFFCMFFLETLIFYKGTIFCTILSCFQRYLLFFLHFIYLHFLFFLSICVCLWMMEEVSIFSTWDMVMKNTKVTSILCLCSSIVAWLLGFNLRKEAKFRRIMIPRKWMKAYEGLKSWSSVPTFWP